MVWLEFDQLPYNDRDPSCLTLAGAFNRRFGALPTHG